MQVYGFEQYNDNCPKSRVIKEQVLQPLDLEGSDLLFVDDDRKNVEEVKRQLEGVEVIHVKQRAGMVEDECIAALAWAHRRLESGLHGQARRQQQESKK